MDLSLGLGVLGYRNTVYSDLINFDGMCNMQVYGVRRISSDSSRIKVRVAYTTAPNSLRNKLIFPTEERSDLNSSLD